MKKDLLDSPLVTIICICHNQASYVMEGLRSVASQDYGNIQLLIADDASTDGSVGVIETFLAQNPIEADGKIFAKENMGHCQIFNKALEKARGKYVIDLAADDVLMPDRVGKQVKLFESLGGNYGVVFSDAYLIDQSSKTLSTFYPRNGNGDLLQAVPSGWIYPDLIRKMVICCPTMMIKKEVLDELGGYDGTLSYEDYDFWVRSGRLYQYYYQDEILTKKRVLGNSQTKRFYLTRQNPHLASTLKVCQKAKALNQNEQEDQALAVSIRYHQRLALFTENFSLSVLFFKLLVEIGLQKPLDRIFWTLAKMKIPLSKFYHWYLNLRLKRQQRSNG